MSENSVVDRSPESQNAKHGDANLLLVNRISLRPTLEKVNTSKCTDSVREQLTANSQRLIAISRGGEHE